MRVAPWVMAVLIVAVAGCSTGEREPRTLRDLRTNTGEPEEFSIVPNKPLVTPPSFNELPEPAPGAANRTDQNPKADLVVALGGNPARLEAPAGAIGAGDQALVQRASRFGREETIRTTLAQEDEDFRLRRGRFTWSIVPEDDYNRVYRTQRLDPYTWLRRYRQAGAVTPTAPPRQ
jgi:hypothetical protein